jgi:hypothetical protein
MAKILSAVTGNKNVYQLAVIVSGSGAMKLLGVPVDAKWTW